MDLGLSASADFFSSGSFTPEEIKALINPTGTRLSDMPSAIQVLLNHGAEYLSQKAPYEFDTLVQSFTSFLKEKSDKIQSVTSVFGENTVFQNPFVCFFDIGATDRGYIALDWRLSYVLVDALLGGINGVSIEKRPDEPYSEIEKNILMPLIHQLLSLVATDRDILIQSVHLSNAWPLGQHTHTRYCFLVKTPVLNGKLMLELPTSLVPKPAEQPLLSVEQLSDIPVCVQAVMSGFQTSLADVMGWQVGTELTLGNVQRVQTDLTVSGKAVAGVQLKTDMPDRSVCVEVV